MITIGYKITGFLVAVIFLSSASFASDQPAKWYGWQFRIDHQKCELTRNYTIGTAGDEASRGFLKGTDYTDVMFHIVANTNSRNTDRYQIGESIFGIKIWSQAKKEPEDQLAQVLFGEHKKEAAEKSKWAGSDEMKQAFSGFWFYGAEADELIYSLAQEESLPLVFISGTGTRMIEIDYQSKKRDRFRAWSEAFRACAMANQE